MSKKENQGNRTNLCRKADKKLKKKSLWEGTQSRPRFQRAVICLLLDGVMGSCGSFPSSCLTSPRFVGVFPVTVVRGSWFLFFCE